MDPAHNPSGLSRFDRMEAVLQQHEDLLAVTKTEARQRAVSHEQALTALAASNEQSMRAMAADILPLTNTLASLETTLNPPVVPLPPALSLGPAPEPRVGTPERYTGDPEGFNHKLLHFICSTAAHICL